MRLLSSGCRCVEATWAETGVTLMGGFYLVDSIWMDGIYPCVSVTMACTAPQFFPVTIANYLPANSTAKYIATDPVQCVFVSPLITVSTLVVFGYLLP